MHFITMRISGNKLDLDNISSILKCNNANCHKKGDVTVFHDETFIFQENVWEWKKELEDYKEISSEVEAFVNKIYKYHAFIKELSSENEISVWVTIYIESVQLNFHLSDLTMMKLHEMGVCFDVSIMNLSELEMRSNTFA